MALTPDQEHFALLGPCIVLRFLVRPETRTGPRQSMVGFSDSAIFHRWMDLFWTFREPDAVALLTPEERNHLAEFNEAFESLEWQPIETHPFISEVDNGDLSKLVPSATRLLECLERRTRAPVLRRWWRRLLEFFHATLLSQR